MFKEALGVKKMYIATGYTDLRFGVDGLANEIQNVFQLDPFEEGILFLFCGRKNDRIKGLLWEGDGFLLLYKRIEKGRFQWPRSSDELREMTSEQYERLMSGFNIYATIQKSEARYIL